MIHETPGQAPARDPMTETGSFRLAVDVAALTDRGHVRDTNEDSYIVFRIGRYIERVASNIPEADLPSVRERAGHLMIVADGMGGHEAGDVASRTALITLLQLMLRSPRWAVRLDDASTREAEIRQLIERGRTYLTAIHQTLRLHASTDPALAGMGTTMTGAYVIDKDLFVMNVGDSKAYLLHGGTLKKITRDHTVAQDYVDLGVISPEEVSTHRMQHVLTRAVGGPDEDVEGDFYHLTVTPGDRLLICSDGLTDMASEQEIAAILAEHPTSENACRGLIEFALSRGGKDNVTAVVAGFTLTSGRAQPR